MRQSINKLQLVEATYLNLRLKSTGCCGSCSLILQRQPK